MPGQFQKGNSGNPAGRSNGARNRLSEGFLQVLADDFQANGKENVELVRKKRPHDYLKIVASVMPKRMELEDVRGPTRLAADMTDDELAAPIDDTKRRLAIINGTETYRAAPLWKNVWPRCRCPSDEPLRQSDMRVVFSSASLAFGVRFVPEADLWRTWCHATRTRCHSHSPPQRLGRLTCRNTAGLNRKEKRSGHIALFCGPTGC
jgi:hypothetical protein